MSEGFRIVPLERSSVAAAKELVRDYVRWIAHDLSFQHVEEELADFPGKYAEPEGGFLLAREGGVLLGCVALKRLDAETCEMKRLFVREAARGRGIGKALVLALLEAAREKGYRRIRLDTLSWMEGALRLYRELGFREIEQYVENPLEGAVFMEKGLDETG